MVHVLRRIRRPRTIPRQRDTMQIPLANHTAATLVITTEVVAEAGDTVFQEEVGMVVREVLAVEGYIIRAWRARRCGDPQ